MRQVTGVSGHIGFRVLTEALVAGYRVYAVVRKEAQVAKIKAAGPVQPFLSQLELVVIPDLAAPGAFDVVPESVWAIIHIATPTFSGFEDVNVADFTATAWRLTLNVLDYAVKTTSVKRVVITSSISAITPYFKDSQDSSAFYTSKTPPPDKQAVGADPVAGKSPVLVDRLKAMPEVVPEPTAYVLSKIYVADKVREFVESNRPGFSLTNVIPGATVGPNELASTPAELMAGSNLVALGPLMAVKFTPVPTVLSHIGDVSIAHVEALDLDLAPGEISNILPVFNSKADATPIEWDDSIRFVKEDFPEATASGLFPFGGTIPAQKVLADSTADEELLGKKFKGYKESVQELIQQYLRLANGGV